MNMKALEPYLNQWHNLAPRERLMLVAGAAFVALLLFYLLLWQPLRSDIQKWRKTVPEGQAKLATMRAQAEEARSLKAKAANSAGSANLLSTLEQTSTTRGIRQSITRMEPEGANGARVVFDEVDFNLLANWLTDLQKSGVRVENASLQRKSAAGQVGTKLLVRAPQG